MATQKEYGKMSSMMHKLYHQAAAASEQAAKLLDLIPSPEEEEVITACDELANAVMETAGNLEQHLINVMEERRKRSREPQPGDQLGMDLSEDADEHGKQLTA